MNTMTTVIVKEDNGKFKVLCNYIQHGIAYNVKAMADKVANELKQQIGIK